MAVVRWDPIREMVSLRQAMDRLFDDTFAQNPGDGLHSAMRQGIPVDVYQNASEVVVQATLPGIKPDDLEVTVERGHLIIKGEAKVEQAQDVTYLVHERQGGVFGRIIPLPSEIDDAKIEAKLEHGILTVRLPKTEAVKPKQIKISAN